MNKRTASWIFIILMSASVTASLAQTALNTALPAIMNDLKVDSATG